MMTETPPTTPQYHCQCGQITGVSCEWTGPLAEMVVVETMPAYLRESDRAAGGGMGVYPLDGSERYAVERSCADLLVEHDPEWIEIIEAPVAEYAEADGEDTDAG